MKHDTIVPYQEDKQKSKSDQVAHMFDAISPRYDFLNRLLSLGIDIYWRRSALSLLKKEKPALILDVATGTADFALSAMRLKPKEIIGIDISEGMLSLGRKKIKKRGLNEIIHLFKGDSEKLNFEDNYFDAVIVAYGVRNFENLEKGLSDIYRVLKKNGSILVLEFSKPKIFPIKQVYSLYFRFILPNIGRMISKDKSAYEYLPASVEAFPDGKEFVSILEKIGFQSIQCKQLTFGISTAYLGKK